MKQLKNTNAKIKKFIAFMAVTVILTALSGILGYRLTKRYKETITDTYYNAVGSISDKINDLQNDILDEMSKLQS